MFICQQFLVDGVVEDEANVTFLEFGREWHRLYFEPGLIFWRSGVDRPLPWEVPDEGWTFRHVDVGQLAGIVGKTLIRYNMWPTKDSARVLFEFDNARTILIEHRHDRGRYVVT